MEDYLALRQQLKQSIRAARLHKDTGGGNKAVQNKYGCFFGPSETVFTDKAAAQTRNLWSKFNNNSSPPNVDAAAAAALRKSKVQRIRESRDYSFLSSAAAAPIPVKGDSTINLKKPIKLIVKIGSVRVDEMMATTNSKLMSMGKKNSAQIIKRCSSTSSSRANKKELKTTTVRKPQEKKELKTNVTAVSKKLQEKKKTTTVSKQEEVKKGTKREYFDYAVEIIREMFGYNPTDFSDDEDDDDLTNMEASFADIQKEEKRSAKIANMEDRQELCRKLESSSGAGCRNRKKIRLN